MSQELASKNAIAALGEQFAQVVADQSLTVAERAEKAAKIKIDMEGHSTIVKQAADVKRMLAGGADITEQVQEVQQGQGQQRLGSIGDQFTKSAAFKTATEKAKGHLHFTESAVVKTNFAEGVFDGTQNVSNYPGTAGPFFYPQQVPGIVGINQRPLVVEDFLPAGAATSPVVSYIIESSWANAAAFIAESSTKPQMTTESFQRVNEPINKVAQFYKLSDEMLLDADQVKSWIDARLLYGLGGAVQYELLNGSGTLPHIKGFNNRSGYNTLQVSGSLLSDPGAWATALLAQLTAIRNTGFTEPTAIMVNPLDWQAIQNLRDKNGQYLNGGPYGRAYGVNAPNVATFWGLPLVSTLSQPQGTALVGNFGDSMVWNRQGVTVEMTNSDGVDFQNDIVTVRAERRLGLAVYRPLSFGQVTLTA